MWKKRFNDEVEESSIYVIEVERVLQIEDYGEVWLIFNVEEYLLSKDLWIAS